ncbi:MAG: hypothetical protein IKQ17_14775, partial [Kiritimatiellae bacterium]|nr:hypothetical protein [Kiritimatiellia bacterium]
VRSEPESNSQKKNLSLSSTQTFTVFSSTDFQRSKSAFWANEWILYHNRPAPRKGVSEDFLKNFISEQKSVNSTNKCH